MTRRQFLGAAATATTASAMAKVIDGPAHGAVRDSIAPSELEALRGLASAFMDKYDVPGLSVAYAKDDRLVFAEGFGFADRGAQLRVTPASRFRIASVSKPITSVAVYHLVEQKRLRLTDTVFGRRAVLGTDYGAQPYGPHVEEITVEHLLTHTSGGWPNDGRDPMFQRPELGHAELIGWTLDTRPLDHPPGTHYAYSNFGYCVLGRVIEKVSGQPYADFVRDAVLKSCGISRMAIAGNRLADRQKDEVRYYAQGGGSPYGLEVARMDAHGGWVASATDLLRLAVRVDGFPPKPDILLADSIRSMTAASHANANYAKGWAVNASNNWWHSGSLPGTTTILVRASNGFCWSALANVRRSNTPMAADLDRLMWAMLGKVTAWPSGDLFGA